MTRFKNLLYYLKLKLFEEKKMEFRIQTPAEVPYAQMYTLD